MIIEVAQVNSIGLADIEHGTTFLRYQNNYQQITCLPNAKLTSKYTAYF